ncbi:MAG: hypothetical protein HOA90_03520, partial [Prolixibacteraceae bacterium]|nr:hypothetical protein [Prolixibacteraceae bacterium]
MKRSYRFLLSISSGILLSLAWLGFPGWTLFIAFLPLLILDHFFVEKKANYRSVSFWGHTFLAFIIWNMLTTWWVSHATFVGAVMAVFVNSFLMSLVWWLAHAARRNFKSNLAYLALIVFWISFEYFHFHWDIEWPWLTLGNGFANNVKMIQWYEFTGTLGGTLWILMMNIFVFKIVLNFQKNILLQKAIYPVAAFVVFLIVPLSFSFSTYFSYVEKENPKNIVIVQPNIDPYSENYDVEAENEKLNKFLRLSESKADNNTDFIIGPETIFERYPDWDVDRLQYNGQQIRLTNFLQKYSKAELVFGVTASRIYPNKENATSTARTRNGVIYDVFNSAIFIDRNGQNQVYHKSILVVGVEKMPFM